MAAEVDLQNFVTPGTQLHGTVGKDLASLAGVLGSVAGQEITHRYHRVTGALAITGITVPFVGFSGTVTFFPTGAFTWTVATNIALAGTAVVGKALDFHYNPVTQKWYPSYIA